MIKYFVFICFISSLSANAFTVAGGKASPKSTQEVKKIVRSYRHGDLEKNLREFVKNSVPSRFIGTSGHKNARDYIISKIKGAQKSTGELLVIDDFVPSINSAIKMYQNDFNKKVASKLPPEHETYRAWANYTNTIVAALNSVRNVGGENIVWEKKGTKYPDQVILVAAHYDTISIDQDSLIVSTNGVMPGADNNGSGVAALLSLIEILQNLELERTVRVVFFDYEDLGYLGSKAFAGKYLEKRDGKKYIAFINPIMIGHDSKVSDKKKKTGNMKLYGRKNNSKDKGLAKIVNSLGKKVSTGVHFSYLDNSFEGSSVVSFWDYDIPTLVVTHDRENDPNSARQYTSNDFVETLNLKTFYNSFKYLAGAIVGMANGIK